ncbi:sensor histidine kinase [Marinigracilibium pacificum]|uniref:Histidine kinase n=1 Tax=Marinigracilibium pacificum TaxID=2729599 RepID=A0A848J625_9BACT|nr:histidine kinase [Marinigracilibium pacificum]NMM48582.1 histidine kinase [Marinigracilibium pacificum]
MKKNPVLYFNFKKELKEIFLISLIGIPFAYIMCPSCGYMIYRVAISSIFWVFLWKGNQFLSALLDLKISWVDKPLVRAITGVIGHTLLTAFIVTAIIKGASLFGINIENNLETVIISIGITLVMTLILYSREFLFSWKQAAIDKERMQKEIISAKYETLKNQVNPHFLFNSLNTLTNLVYENQDTAAKFISKLSKVYRYVIEVRDKELVDIKDEISFVDSYIFLQKIRHEGSLELIKDLPLNPGEMIPPLSIQLLIENAIKHNILSEDSPLLIKVYKENDCIVVENNIQLKNIIDNSSTGVGLENIKSRYQYLTKKPVIISNDNSIFRIELPIITR